MKRGTTPTTIFKVPFDTSEINKLYITFKQGTTTLEKTETDCTMSENLIALTLTQAETLGFNTTSLISVQLRVKFNSGAVDASNILGLQIGDILKGGEI